VSKFPILVTLFDVFVRQPEIPSAIFELDTIESFKCTDLEDVNPRYHDIQGRCSPPDGYRMVIPDKDFLQAIPLHTLKPTSEIKVSRSQSWSKVAASIVQLIFSSITIYRTRDNQVIRYGYAAFGLSVFPYTMMSLVNFICVGMVGDYSCKYILRTSVLDEAERRGGEFDGTIGVILKDSDTGNVDAQMEKHEGYYTPAWLSTEVGTAEEFGSATQKTLVVRVGQSTRRFKLLKHDKIPGTCVFGVSSLTSQAARLKSNKSANAIPGYLLLIGSLSVLIIPSAFIYGLTKFKKEGSTLTQRVDDVLALCQSSIILYIRSPLL
jgi:hypothetical protein